MSGDTQPRKRNKDKKRRRDDEETRPTGVHATKMGPEDIQLHVHTDHETGGHWCAKVFFFSLLAILLGLIGLILLENRGLADLDTPLSESRFADMLEGWVDEERELHDEHHNVLDASPNSQEHEDDEEQDHHEHDDHDEHGEHDDANSQENLDNDLAGEPKKDDLDDGNEVDEGFDEDANNASDEDNDTDDDERLRSLVKNSKLTTNTVNNKDVNSRDTNESSRTHHDPKKRAATVEQSDESQAVPVDHVTVRQLELQVDDLVDNYNKLAKSLNRPQIDEANASGIKFSPSKLEDDNHPDIDNNENDDIDGDGEDDDEDVENYQDEHEEDEGIDEQELDDDNDSQENERAVPTVDDDGNEIEPSNDEQTEDEESSSHNDDESKVQPTSDTEKTTAPEDENDEFFDMKRRFTLVTAEEPIPKTDGDVQEQLPILKSVQELSTQSPCDNDVDEDDSDDVRTTEILRVKLESPEQQQHLQQQQQQPTETEYSSEDDVATPELDLHDKSDKRQGFALDNEVLSEEDEEEDEEEVVSSEGNDYDTESSVDDTDLLKRLDEKYGKLPQRCDADEVDDNDVYGEDDDEDIDPTWTKIDRSGPAAILTDDQLLEDEIRRANEQLAENPQSAITLFKQIHQNHPKSPIAQYHYAKALDHLAEINRSNQLLQDAITEYQKYLELDTALNDNDFKMVAERLIDRMRFIGQHLKAVSVHEKLIERFQDDPYYRNQLAVTYLLVNRLSDAKYVLHQTLQRWREDGFAAVHYGFVLKNLDQDFEHAAMFLRQGIDSGANGTSDGRFYFNLGDALIRLGRPNEAKNVYQEAAEKKLFPSEYQRSLYNVDHLKARPFWTLAETGYKHEFRTLEQNWQKIRDEGLNILSHDGYFVDEAENLRDTGVWKQYELFARGKRNTGNCERTPFTCKLIETFPAARFCKRGQVKFSVMHPNTHVWPHCGPTNCRLRSHLALKTADKTSIRVATETRTWIEGKTMVFDDSFEHEVWHNGTEYRLILIIDVWHPDLTAHEKKTLIPI